MKTYFFFIFLVSLSLVFPSYSQELHTKWVKWLQNDSLNSAAFSPDDRYFIAGGPSKIYKFNTEDASVVWTIPFGGTKVAYSNDGSKFYAGYGLEFRIHDAQTGAVLGSFLKDILRKDPLLSYINEFVISPDNSTAYIFVRFKYENTQEWPYFYKPDRYIVFNILDNTILHDVQTNNIYLDRLVISPDGKWFGMISRDGKELKNPWTAYVDSLIYNKGKYWWNEDKEEFITDVTFSSDSKYFVYCSESGVARYINLESMKKEGYLDPPSGDHFLSALTFNNNNQLFIGGSPGFSALSIWDFNRDKQMIGYYPNFGVNTNDDLLTTKVLPYLLRSSRSYYELWDLDSTVSVPLNSENKNTDILIFNDTLNIETSSLKATVIEIIISDLQGKRVFAQTFSRFENKITLSLSNLPVGAYLCSVRSEKEILSSFKFLINR